MCEESSVGVTGAHYYTGSGDRWRQIQSGRNRIGLTTTLLMISLAGKRIRFDCCQSHLLIAFYNLAKWESYLKDALPQDINPFVFAKEYNIHPDILSTSLVLVQQCTFQLQRIQLDLCRFCFGNEYCEMG
ncbi:hypothetical protein AABB24_014007 [Solanum stoloniferum]|uniref:Uncharacterized protein n=1 Tax=Solanum stoloniferum TaxID=62892 RepID=A0ABD2TX41_9SOLN